MYTDVARGDVTKNIYKTQFTITMICIVNGNNCNYYFSFIIIQRRELSTFEKQQGNRIATFICYVSQLYNSQAVNLVLANSTVLHQKL